MNRFGNLLLASVFLLGSFAWGQALPDNPQPREDNFPRPYVIGGLALLPGGYQPAGWEVGAGLEFERPHLVVDTLAAYDNGRKTNDGGPNNPKGHDRYLQGFAAYRFSSSYIGAGARWSELDTTNYTKTSWHPEIGVGHDLWPNDKFYPNFARLQVAWMFKARDEKVTYPGAPPCYVCGNGTQGVDITVWLPSPDNTKYKHVFARFDAEIYGFHNLGAGSGGGVTTAATVLIGYRF